MSFKARFTLGVRAYVQPNPTFLLVQKLKSAPRAFTLGVKAGIEKNVPEVTNKC
jgi:hypothetical protein